MQYYQIIQVMISADFLNTLKYFVKKTKLNGLYAKELLPMLVLLSLEQ